MHKGLIALLLGGLTLGITEFSMMGLLPDFATSLDVSIPRAGYLIAMYALGVVVGAPSLVLIAGRYPPKKILIFLVVLITVFNFLSAFAPNFNALLFTRFLSGLPHGAFFGVGAVVASRIAKKGKEAQAVSIMFAGLTIANLAGVPLGTFIGHHVLWRYTFILITLVGIITIIGVIMWIPVMKAKENKSIKKEFAFFAHLDSWLIILLTAIGTGGLFSWISYIAPLLINISHFDITSVPYIMSLAGLGMVIGNLLGGRLSDKYAPTPAIIMLLIAMTLALIIIFFTAQYQTFSLGMTFISGIFSFSRGAPIQILMMNSSKGSEMLASSVSQACFNLGNALGAFLGGLPLAFGFDYNYPELIGVVMTSTGILIALVIMSRTRKTTLP